MEIGEITYEEQLAKATSSSNIEELSMLCESSYMNVRRAVARNRNIDSVIANTLVRDPVLNVSYMAAQNPNCTITKDYICECVKCEKDERELECTDCVNKRVY